MIEDPRCPICELKLETPFHILWECPSAMDAWGASCKLFQKSAMKGPGFINLLEGVLRHGQEEEIQLFAGLTRLLWLRGNEFLHEGRFTNPNVLVQMANSKVMEFNKLHEGNATEPTLAGRENMQNWKPPEADILKANWDAALNIKGGKMGMGVVIRDHAGGFRAAKCSFINGRFDPTVAESMQAVHAISLCKKLGIDYLCLEEDAKNVLSALLSREENWSPMGHIVADAKKLLEASNPGTLILSVARLILLLI
jgi:hypothetical protein